MDVAAFQGMISECPKQVMDLAARCCWVRFLLVCFSFSFFSFPPPVLVLLTLYHTCLTETKIVNCGELEPAILGTSTQGSAVSCEVMRSSFNALIHAEVCW